MSQKLEIWSISSSHSGACVRSSDDRPDPKARPMARRIDVFRRRFGDSRLIPVVVLGIVFNLIQSKCFDHSPISFVRRTVASSVSFQYPQHCRQQLREVTWQPHSRVLGRSRALFGLVIVIGIRKSSSMPRSNWVLQWWEDTPSSGTAWFRWMVTFTRMNLTRPIRIEIWSNLVSKVMTKDSSRSLHLFKPTTDIFSLSHHVLQRRRASFRSSLLVSRRSILSRRERCVPIVPVSIALIVIHCVLPQALPSLS